jgi:hypothetical protein
MRMQLFRFKFSISLVVSLSASSQIATFNPAYRYNYKYDYSKIVTQVIFADSTKISGSDTTYYLNRIGPPTTFTPNYVQRNNTPQFLQRGIKKTSTGLLILKDTATLVIQPLCQLNQIWIFDSINNKTATCTAISNENLFGQNHSVKTIIIGNTDTLKLSDKFGIVQFPALYGKNKYYRLSGIENEVSYDSVALYGEKVPNAWDFFNFDTGDRFCERYLRQYQPFSSPSVNECYTRDYVIISKSVTSSGISYSVADHIASCGSVFTPATEISYPANILKSKSTACNRWYPGLWMHETNIDLTYIAPTAGSILQEIKFGLDSKGRFYKYSGKDDCALSTGIGFPFPSGSDHSMYNAYYTEIYGVGLGALLLSYFENPGRSYIQSKCQTCAIKNNSLYYGNETFVDVNEQTKGSSAMRIFPNPSSGRFEIRFEDNSSANLMIVDLLGHEVKRIDKDSEASAVEIDLSKEPGGLYFLQYFNTNGLSCTKKILKN